MTIAIASIGSSTVSTTSASDANNSRKAQLEKQLAAYLKELAEAQQNASSKEGALRLQLIEQKILAIQQQIAQLSLSSTQTTLSTQTATTSQNTAAQNTQASAALGNRIDISI